MYVSKTRSGFPLPLLSMPDPPVGLYYRGSMTNFDWREDILIAVVGSRLPTGYGERMAYHIARDLARSGVVVVSGLAQGTDTFAHRGALDGGGRTVAVLGTGIDRIYPADNLRLAGEIVEKGGLVVSEYPPGCPVNRQMFVARNRLVSALSRGVLVVEGGARSGTLTTSRFAAEQGRDVFALPGQVGNQNSLAPHFLLKQGAVPVTGAADILAYYGLKYNP